MKGVICVLALVSLFLSAGTCLAQQLTDWEQDVYYDYVEEYYTSSIPRDDDYDYKLDSMIANKYGISVDKVVEIIDRANKKPTQRELDIKNEVWEQLAALGNNVSRDDSNRVYQQIADKYGLTLRHLYEIMYRISLWNLGPWEPD